MLMNSVGIDVSKGKSMIAVMRPFGDVVGIFVCTNCDSLICANRVYPNGTLLKPGSCDRARTTYNNIALFQEYTHG